MPGSVPSPPPADMPGGGVAFGRSCYAVDRLRPMTRLHSDMDIYVGEELAFAGARVLEYNERGELKIETRKDRGGAWETRALFTGAEVLSGTSASWVWEAKDADGNKVRVSAIRRTTACGQCGGGR